MKIITPADKLKAIARLLGLAKLTSLLKKIISPPMHVARPAPVLRANASPTSPPVLTMMT